MKQGRPDLALKARFAWDAAMCKLAGNKDVLNVACTTMREKGSLDKAVEGIKQGLGQSPS